MAQATTGRRGAGVAVEGGEATDVTPVPASVRRFAFWSAIATATTYAVFLLGYFVGSLLSPPWDIALPVGVSILIAPSFVLLMVGVHYSAAESKRIWSHAAIAFAVLYAAFVSIVYVTWLFVVEPHVLNQTQNAIAPFAFAKGSFIQMLDGLGYTYMSLAVSLTAPVFSGGRLAKWIRGVAVANGPAAIGVLLSYILFSFPFDLLGLPGTLLTLVYAVLLAVHFHRAKPAVGLA